MNKIKQIQDKLSGFETETVKDLTAKIKILKKNKLIKKSEYFTKDDLLNFAKEAEQRGQEELNKIIHVGMGTSNNESEITAHNKDGESINIVIKSNNRDLRNFIDFKIYDLLVEKK